MDTIKTIVAQFNTNLINRAQAIENLQYIRGFASNNAGLLKAVDTEIYNILCAWFSEQTNKEPQKRIENAK